VWNADAHGPVVVDPCDPHRDDVACLGIDSQHQYVVAVVGQITVAVIEAGDRQIDRHRPFHPDSARLRGVDPMRQILTPHRIGQLGKVAELEVEVAAAGSVGKQQIGLGQVELEGALEQTQVAAALHRKVSTTAILY
jgi:hypothetical protein